MIESTTQMGKARAPTDAQLRMQEPQKTGAIEMRACKQKWI
jgi:hypothetical protein